MHLSIRTLVGAALFFVAGCTSNPWTVVRQADPNPLLDQREWVVEPLRFEGTVVDGQPLAVYLAQQDLAFRSYDPRYVDPRALHDLRGDLQVLSEGFVWKLTQDHGTLHVAPSKGSSLGSFTIRGVVHGLSTGLRASAPGYPPMQTAPAEAFVTLTLLDPEGREIDVVDTQTDASTDEDVPHIGGALGDCGVRVANLAVGYLATRVVFRAD